MQRMEKINELATVAGVQQSKGPIQCLHYSDTWMKEEYKLLELTDELANLVKEGNILTIRGEGEDEAVLCTQNKTFDLKAADTSNALLLLPHIQTPKTHNFQCDKHLVDLPVYSSFNSYFEVKLSRARLGRLKFILKEHCFSGESLEGSQKLTTDDLLDAVQASKEELMEGLKQLGAIYVDNQWLLLEINYQEKAFSQILALMEEKCWSWKEIPFPETVQMLNELYPEFVLEHCLKTYGVETDTEKPFSQILALMEEKCWSWKEIPLPETVEMLNELYPEFVLEHCLKTYGVETDTEKRVFSLSEDQVCTYYAEYILRPALGKFNFHEFMTAWKESVPDGMTTSLGHLKGVALVDMKNHPPVIWHFSEHDLPDSPAERFTMLFKTRPRWKEEDITPYLVNVLGPNQKLSSLFLKYARSSKDENGDKVYSCR
eukprot:TCONS_00022755-protein